MIVIHPFTEVFHSSLYLATRPVSEQRVMLELEVLSQRVGPSSEDILNRLIHSREQELSVSATETMRYVLRYPTIKRCWELQHCFLYSVPIYWVKQTRRSYTSYVEEPLATECTTSRKLQRQVSNGKVGVMTRSVFFLTSV